MQHVKFTIHNVLVVEPSETSEPVETSESNLVKPVKWLNPDYQMSYLFAKSVLNVGCNSDSVLSAVSTWCEYTLTQYLIIQKNCDDKKCKTFSLPCK